MSPLRFPARFRASLSTSFLRRLHARPSPGGRLEEAGPLVCRLESRSVVRFRGPDTIKFLQGLLTNDVRRLDPQHRPAGGGGGESQTSYILTPNLNHRPLPPLYAALLTPQGRFLYDLFLYHPPRADEKLDRTGSGPGSDDSEEPFTLLADVDAAVVDELLDCLKKYHLRSKVEIDNVAKEFSCWQRFGGNLSRKAPSTQEPEAASIGWGKGVDHAGVAAAKGNDLGWQWFEDPRLNCLGYRGIFPTNSTPPLVEADKEANEQHYLLWRLQKGVPEGSTEIPKGCCGGRYCHNVSWISIVKEDDGHCGSHGRLVVITCASLVQGREEASQKLSTTVLRYCNKSRESRRGGSSLEYNLVGLNAISFDKGCYLGQELVARTHHRGVIRKRLFPLKFVNDNGEELEQAVSPNSEIVDYGSNKKVGTVTTTLGCHGMGLVRVEEGLKQSSNLSIKDREGVRVRVSRPGWWPVEWTQLEEQQSVAA